MSQPISPPPLSSQTITQPKIFRPPTTGQLVEHLGCIYYIGNPLGAGYFGTVFECWDEWGNELVAKVLIPKGQTYDEVREQWLDELVKLAQLRHPNITYVYGAFEFQDTFYLILERCGHTLKDLITMPGLEPNLWVPHVAQALLQALEFMHRAGYVHKDIHPGNVFLKWISDSMVPTKPPVLQIKVGDLGITRLESDINVFHTMLAQWMLPPEALDPLQYGLIGKQVDIYHTGLLLLSLLLGRVPTFSEQDVRDGVPRQLAEGLSSPYASLVAWALRRHTTQRPQTAMELWRAFRSLQMQLQNP